MSGRYYSGRHLSIKAYMSNKEEESSVTLEEAVEMGIEEEPKIDLNKNGVWTKYNPWTNWTRYVWKWSPNRKKDNGEHLKKPWIRKWTTYITEQKVKLDIGRAVNWMTYGKKEVSDRAKELWAVPWVPMSIKQVSAELGITHFHFYRRMSKYPEAKELYNELRGQRRDYLKEVAENTIADWLEWKLDLSGKERVDTAFKMLEKTDKSYQPKQEIEQKSVNINIHKSTDDIMSELTSILWVK